MILRFSHTFIILIVILSSNLTAQSKVEIFADVQSNDTMQKLISILTEQLVKAGKGSYSVMPASFYKKRGIYINTTTASHLFVKPSTELLKAGVEGYSVNANGETVQILGNSYMAVGHGMFAYLESMGYRFYFANPDWHIAPVKPNLFKEISIVSNPSFLHRRIWYGYGTGSEKADADYNFWKLANKLGGSINASFGHSYDDIVAYNPEMFTKHPEWLYPQPPPGKNVMSISNPKFDMSNEELVQFVIQDVLKRIEKSKKNKTPEYKMVSLGPSDGGGTCNTPACRQLGTPSDRVYYLVNRVAAAVRKKFPETWIGCLAYTEYIEPPTKKTEPNVYVSITTAFNPSKFSVEELVDKWSKKTGMVGIYDFFALFAWDYDLPGQSQMSGMGKVIKSIRRYYKAGAKGYEGESSQGWISKGLGHFICAKLLWNVNTDVEAYKKEFFALCFLKASSLMKKMWDEWEIYSYKEPRERDLAKWIDITKEAAAKETDTLVQKRLFQVKSYLHYLYLFREYKAAKTEENLAALLSFGYRLLDNSSIAGFPATYELGNLSGMPSLYVENPDAKWKSNKSPVTENEVNILLNNDRSKLKSSPIVQNYTTTVSFRKVPDLGKYTGPIYDGSQADNKLWYQGEWLMQITGKGSENYIEVSAGYVEGNAGDKAVVISVYPYQQSGDVSGLTPLLKYEYTNRYKQEKILLSKLGPGYYTVMVDDPVKIYTIRFSKPVNYSMVIRPSRQLRATWANNFLFYVPPGTKRFNVLKEIAVNMRTPTGRIIELSTQKREEVLVEVKPGEEGLWKITFFAGDIFIEGVPPYLGVNAAQMLIPATIK